MQKQKKIAYYPWVVFLGAFLTVVYFFGSIPSSNAGFTETNRSTPSSLTAANATNNTFPKWSKVEIELTGPNSIGMSDSTNPFQIEVDVTFDGPNGETFVVPAFYDGDGNGGMDGNVWRVRFSPNAVGSWSYTSSSPNALLDGQTGTFDVVAPTNCSTYTPGGMPNFACVGRLSYIGAHYLKFADGHYWLKGGADEPEDFLAPGNTVGFAGKEDALDYLADKGVNSLYMMLHNVDGDGQNVWPWVGQTNGEAKANDEHFDIAKLAQWEDIFTYAQEKGIVLHLVFEDDSAWTGFNRDMYYREMIARFGHHNGLYWNVSEEFNENYAANQIQGFAQQISDLDAYDHPITVHNQGSVNNWAPFVGDPNFDLTSFQTTRTPQNDTAVTWFNNVGNSGRIIPISFDETGAIGPQDREITRHIVWSIYLGGANYEMYTSPMNSYTQFSDHFEDMSRARTFMETTPFATMQPANSLLSGVTGYVFADQGEAYAAYLPNGGTAALDLSSNTNTFDASWFNPRTGETQTIGTINGGDVRTFTAPDANDWALYLDKIASGGNVAPLATDQSETTEINTDVSFTLNYDDDDGPGPYTFTIVNGPDHGSLSGSGANRTYSPDNDFTGSDNFTWRVNDGLDDSNAATVSIEVMDVSDNQPPTADDKMFYTLIDRSVGIQLSYTDPDNGPGPYTVAVTSDPANGSLSGTDNDRVYTPNAGFAGVDQFSWRVHDGEDHSSIVQYTVRVFESPPDRVFLPLTMQR